MQEEKFLRLNTAIKPPEIIFKKIIKLSQLIGRQYKAEFILDGKNFYPHVTIYSPLYPLENYEKIIEVVGQIAEQNKKIELKYTKLRAEQGFIGIEFELTNNIQELHEVIVSKLNPLRRGHYKEEYDAPEYRMKLPEEKKLNIAKYGHPNVMSLYRPHITIIHLKDEVVAEKVASTLEWDIPSFVADTIAIYKMGEHGTCIKPVNEFNLK